MIKRTVNILYRMGQLTEMPAKIKQMQGELDIEYVGPMVRAQKTDRLVVIDRWLEGQIAQAEFSQGESLDIVDWDAVGRERGESVGVPAKLMKSQADINQERKQRKEQAAQANELAMAEQQGKALKATGEGMESLQGLQAVGG